MGCCRVTDTKVLGPLLLRRLRIEAGQPLRYFLSDPESEPELSVELSAMLGCHVRLRHTGVIRCQACGNSTRKSYSQGHCYPCFKRLASCDLCVMAPHRCHYDKGTCRDPDWGESFCMQPHLVYLANSSGLKVGITRDGQQFGRWRDQGALQGRLLARAATRKAAGELEVQLAKEFGDRSQWRALVSGNADLLDLDVAARQARALVPDPGPGIDYVDVAPRTDEEEAADTATHEFRYPVSQWPPVERLNFKVRDEINGVLTGIKGQYLLFDTGVFNVREHTGYEVVVTLSQDKAPNMRGPVAKSTQQIDLF